MSGPQFNVIAAPSGGYVAAYQAKAAPGRLHWIFPHNRASATRYIQIFDSAALPNDGTPVVWMFPLAPMSAPQKELAFPPDGLVFANGLWVVLSTTPDVKTLAGADLLCTAGVS